MTTLVKDVILLPRKSVLAKDRLPDQSKVYLSREELIEKGICVCCQKEKASEFNVLGRQCLYTFSAIEAKSKRGLA